MVAPWKVNAILLLLALLVFILIAGVDVFCILLVALAVTIYCKADVWVARLACWAIRRIPAAYRWTIELIKVRPSASEKDGGWSEITIVNWTWHNPPGFDDDSIREGMGFVLQFDEVKLRLKLSTLWGALKRHEALEISLFRINGMRFNTHRNKAGSLNLWQALDLPDDDVNVKSIAAQACKYGGLADAPASEEPAAIGVVPLAPISTAATRAAAGFWKPEWGERPDPSASSSSRSCATAASSRAPASPDLERPLLQEKRYVEEPIGDPRRRPRWGVPVRLDVHRLHLLDVQLWVLDIMTADAHRTAWRMHPDKKRIDVHSVNISRQRLEAGDDRRSGSVDDVHGVYLGELVWVVIAELIPLIVKRAPGALSRTAMVAAGLAIKDVTKRVGAKTVQAAHKVGHQIKEAVHHRHHDGPGPGAGGDAHVVVHLIAGRQVTRKANSVNSHAFIELLGAAGAGVAEARSEPQMWTKMPHWDETFELGPAVSLDDVVRVTLYHQKSRQVVGITTHGKEDPERFIGEVCLPLRKLLIRDPVIAEGGEIVGWFPLTDARGLRHGTPCTGQLKLGLRIVGSERLGDCGTCAETASQATRQDWAILR